MPSQTDLSLLERMRDSRLRADAWVSFVDRYTRILFGWFKHWGVDPHSMEDVTQECMMRVLGNSKNFRHEKQGSFRAWLKCLAHRSWLQVQKDTERQLAQREADPARAQAWNSIGSGCAANHLMDLFDAWATEELLNRSMSRVRRRIHTETWETFENIFLKNEPVELVAQAKSISVVQVYNRVSHVRKLIRQELAEIEGLDE